MRILYLTLKKEWFDLIANGTKKIEYRAMKPYWSIRIGNRDFDEVHFRNGYRNNSPFMRVKYLFCDIDPVKPMYRIHLGDIIEITNWELK